MMQIMASKQVFRTAKQKDECVKPRPKRIESKNKDYPLHIPGQKYAVVLVGNAERQSKCREPAFCVLGTYRTVDQAIKVLRESNMEGSVVATHVPYLIGIRNYDEDDETYTRKIDERLEWEKQSLRATQERRQQRLDYAKAQGSVNMYTEFMKKKQAAGGQPLALEADPEGPEAPEVPEGPEGPEGHEPRPVPEVDPATLEDIPKVEYDTIMPLEDKCVAVSVVAADDQEPVIVVHAILKDVEEGERYIVNTVSPAVPYANIHLYQVGEWYFPRLQKDRTGIEDRVYLDEGLDHFFQGIQQSKEFLMQAKTQIKDEEGMAVEPDLTEPAPVHGVTETMPLDEYLARYPQRDPVDYTTNVEGLEQMRAMGTMDDDTVARVQGLKRDTTIPPEPANAPPVPALCASED
jgi:hypothetical protein